MKEASDENLGSILSPLKTLQAAINKCTDSSTNYIIRIDGNLTENVTIGSVDSNAINASSISSGGLSFSSSSIHSSSFASLKICGGAGNCAVSVLDGNQSSSVCILVATSPVSFEKIKFCNGNNTNMTSMPYGYGGGIILASTSSANFTNCQVTDNTAMYGGGVYVALGTLTFTDCTISNNTASKISLPGGLGETGGLGGAVFNNDTFVLKGDVSIPVGDGKNNDVYLPNGKYITIGSSLSSSPSSTVATITPASYSEEIQVLAELDAEENISSTVGDLVSANYSKFSVTQPSDSTSSQSWAINSSGKLSSE